MDHDSETEGLEVKALGAGWFPAEGDLMAGFLYVIDDDGHRYTLATPDFEYHAMVIDSWLWVEDAPDDPPIEFDPELYQTSTPKWVTDGAAVIIDPDPKRDL